jgi:integrase
MLGNHASCQLCSDEVVQFLEAVSSLKSRAALTTAYAAGLRASAVAGLRVEDIDSARGVIRCVTAKGRRTGT